MRETTQRDYVMDWIGGDDLRFQCGQKPKVNFEPKPSLILPLTFQCLRLITALVRRQQGCSRRPPIVSGASTAAVVMTPYFIHFFYNFKIIVIVACRKINV